MSWTQPMCDACWTGFTFPLRPPVRQREPVDETCCQCGATTSSGIYVPVDPTTVPHPAKEES